MFEARNFLARFVSSMSGSTIVAGGGPLKNVDFRECVMRVSAKWPSEYSLVVMKRANGISNIL